MVLKSRKFQYAVAVFVAVLIVTFLPSIFSMDAEQTDTLYNTVPYVFFAGYALIGGHSLMDALSMASGKQLPKLDEAVKDLKDAIEKP